jgi:hypothetical protein
MRVWIAFALMIGLPISLIGERLHKSVQQPFLTRVIVVPASEFSVPRLKARFEHFLSAEGESVQTQIVRVYCHEQDKSSAYKYTNEVNYKRWKQWYEDYIIPPSAELLSIGGNAAMRVRLPDGTVDFLILRGSDPYAFKIGEEEFHLLHIIARDTVPFDAASYARWKKGKEGFRSTLELFVLSDQDVTTELAKAIAERLRVTTGAGQVSVSIRKDIWFITDEDFPIAYPYATIASPPTKERYLSSPTTYCQATLGQVNCSSY